MLLASIDEEVDRSEEIAAVLASNQFLMENSNACMTQFMQPYYWLICVLELVVGVSTMLLNGMLAVAIFYSTSILFKAVISLNYLFMGAIFTAKKIVLLLAIYYPCVTVVSTISCKLQEFPVVFSYLYCAITSLVLASQLSCLPSHSIKQSELNGRRMRRNVDFSTNCGVNDLIVGQSDWTRCCSADQPIIIIFCLGLSLLFTAFDNDFDLNLLQKCSILVAIRDRNLAFCLITILIVIHGAGILVWSLLARAAKNSLNDSKLYSNKLSSSCNIVELRNSNGNESKSGVSLKSKWPAYSSWGKNRKESNDSNAPCYIPNNNVYNEEIEYELNALNCLKLSLRDIASFEAITWLISLFFTGLTLVGQFVARRNCSKCSFFAIELSFTFFPLLIAFAHSPLCFWHVQPIRRAATQLFPIFLSRVLPPFEPDTPPLPKKSISSVEEELPEPTVKILITKYDSNSPTTTSSTISNYINGS